MKQAKNGDTVKVHYTGRLDDGTIFDSSEGKDPLQFTIGEGQLLQAFEQGVTGLAEGDKKNLQLTAQQGYGLKQNKLIGKLPLEALPEGLTPEIGMRLQMKTPEDQLIILKIVEMSDNDITVDANHELAGEDLNFEIELVAIES
jgi:peptidylprolyl isomerase